MLALDEESCISKRTESASSLKWGGEFAKSRIHYDRYCKSGKVFSM
jgi:hypothetical protein